MNPLLLLSSVCLVAGGLLLVYAAVMPRRSALVLRLPRAAAAQRLAGVAVPTPARDWLQKVEHAYGRELRRAGRRTTTRRLLRDKLLVGVAAPLVLMMPFAAATGRLPSPIVLLAIGLAGSFAPDVALRAQVRRRRESIYLDLPDAVAVLSLSLGAGQSLRQALELAARDCSGPLGEELTRALSIARRQRGVSERDALAEVARDSGEESFARFAELLRTKESPYLDFLRTQARTMRADQNRYLQRAADRAYLAMHAPLVPLLAVIVLLVAYGFLHVLAETI